MFEEDDDDLYDHDTGGDYATDLSSQNRRATPGGLDFSAFGERVAAPETAAPRQAGPKLDFSNFGEKVTVPTDPPLPRSRPAAANQSAEPQQAPQPLSTEAAVPLPRPRPDIGPNPADENYAAPLEDAPFRSGGKALDKIWGSTGGMLTGEEAYGEHQKRVAAAEAELATARAEREAAEARIAGRSTNPEDAATADPRLMRRALTLAQRRESEAQKALTAAQNHAPSTQGELRNAAEIVIGGLASGGADMLRNARGLSEVTPSLTRLIDPEAERRYRQGQRQFTEGVDEAAKRVGAPDPAQAEDIGSQLISGATSMGMFMAGGLAARALGAPGAIGSAGLGAFQQGGQLLGEAETAIKVLDRRIAATKAQGLDATPLEAQRDTLLKTKYIAMFAGMGLGATEAIPVERFFNRLNQVTGGRVGAILANTTTQSMEEMLQEIGQQIGSNVVARVLYDEGRDIFKDVNQSAAVAGVLGGLMGMGAGAFAPVRTSDAQAALPDPLIPAPGASPIEQAFQNAPSPIEEVFRRAGEIAGAPAAQPLSPEVGGVPQSGTEDRGGAAEAGPQPKVSAIERRVLRKKGYTDEDIDAMNRAEITAELGEAAQQGVAAAEEEPSAEPASDIMAQVEDLKAGKRGAVWLPKATVEHLQSTGALDAATSAGTVLKDFDGNGGILIAKDAATARQARKDRTGGGDVQEIVGRLTGAGTGKPPGADTVVQQKDQQGNVTRESLVTDEQAAPTAQAFAEPGRDVDIKPGVEALIDRNDRVDAEADQAMAGLSEMFGGQPQAQQPGAKLDFSDQGVPVEGDGSKTSPVKINDPDDLSRVDEQVAANPTAAQKEAENYKMGHVRWPGLRRAISIETAKGGTRADKNGKWRVPNYPVRYGRIKGTKGADGQQLDIFVGDDATVPHAFILDQFDPQTGKFDEHKIWVGIRDAAEVARIYDSVFTDGSGPARRRAISQVPMKVLNAWAFDGRKKKPFVKAAQAEKQQTVRLYRGETAGRNEENGGYYTTDRAMAEGFGRIRYVDMPREDADFFKMPGMGGAIYDLTNYPAGPSGVNWREKSKFLDGNGTQKDAETAVTAAIDAAFDDGSEAAPIEQPKGDIIDAKESVHEAILNVGMSPSQVDEADINAAAEIVAETNTNPADAFQQVMAEQIEETADAEQQPVSGSVEVGAQGGQQEEGELVSGGGEAVEAQTGEDQAGGEDRADQAGGLDFSDQAERPGEDEQAGDAAEAEDAGVAKTRAQETIDRARAAADRTNAREEENEKVRFQELASRSMEAALDKIEEAVEAKDRKAVLAAARAANKLLAETPQSVKDADPEYWSQFKAVIKGMTKPGYVTAKQEIEGKAEHQAETSDHIESGEESTETRETGFVETAIDKPAEDTEKTKIEDAGEKIGGARKDQWTGGMQPHDLDDMSGAERHKLVTKEKVWPRLDYAQLVEDGVDPVAAYGIKLIYDRLPGVPQPAYDKEVGLSHQIKYIGILNAIRSAVSKVKTWDDLKKVQDQVNEEITGETRRWGTDEFGPAMQKRGRKVSFNHPAGLAYSDHSKATEAVKEGFPNLEPWQRIFAVKEVTYGRDKGQWYVVRGKQIVADNLPDRDGAVAAAKAAYEKIGQSNEDKKKTPERPRLDSINRVGPDIRKGRDVTSEDFISDFGFRGIEFGNYVASDERQKNVNLAYDALHDLARIFDIPAKALSLNGTLGLAFGARGVNGAAAAHYEPAYLVVNLTKVQGAGTLAHEWAHALDHYLGEVDSPNAYGGAPKGISGWHDVKVKENTYPGRKLPNLTPRLNRAVNDLMQTIHFKKETDTDAQTRQQQQDDRGTSGLKSWEDAAERAKAMLRMGKDTRKAHGLLRRAERQIEAWKYWNERKKREGEGKRWVPSDYYREAQKISGSGVYWFRPTELFARAFESYIFDRLANEGDGHSSQYLVHSVEPNRFGTAHKGNPYPTGDERAAINSAFDEFVRALQATEGKHGEGSKLIGKDKEDWKTPTLQELWQTPTVTDITPVKPVTSEEKIEQLEDEMKALDDATKAMESGEEKVNRSATLAATFANHLREGNGFGNILAARKMAKEAGFDQDAKSVEEAMELAVVTLAREIAADRSDPKANFTALVDLYSRQPKLGTRTSTSMRDQAFSTPVPLAYVASRLANASEGWVLEPTAGNGALLIEVDPSQQSVTAIDVNQQRVDNLKSQGFDAKRHQLTGDSKDAGDRQIIPKGVDVVITNPPFGAVKEDGQSTIFDLSDIQPGYQTREIDHAIAHRALAAMRQGGRAVLILGGLNKLAVSREARSDGYNSKAKREFYKTLYDRYNVVDHFTVAGELYERQGAGWPVDVIVIDGRGKSSRKLPAVDVPRVLNSWDQLGGLLDGLPQRSDAEARAASERPADRGPDGGNGRVRGDGERVSEGLSPQGQSGDVQRGSDREPAGAGGEGRGKPARDERGDAERTGVEPAPERRPPELTDDFDAAFDAALDQTFGPQAGPKSSSAPAKPRDTRTTGEVAKSAAKNIAGSADDAMSALTTMFGGGKIVGMGLNVDPQKYEQAKPLFVQAAQKFSAFKDDIGELMRRMMGHLRDTYKWTREMFVEAKPYFEKFIADVRSGVVSLTPKAAETPAAKPAVAVKEEQETDKQVKYVPQSKGGYGLGTLVPVNMKTSVSESLADLEKRVGNIDQYVMKELGYTANEFHTNFAAEQIDALGLAIDNIKNNKGFIIGDQTGIGKGRVNAAIIRWAIKNGKIPVFVTEKPNLYSDMYRDLSDTGIQSFLGDREPSILETNALDKDLPLGDDGKVMLKSTSTAQKTAILRDAMDGRAKPGKLNGYDVVFTTYNQMQTVAGNDTARRSFLMQIAPQSVLIFDESHNAGGQGAKSNARKKKGAPADRSGFARELVEGASGVFYSSATYAKRPDVMDLYSKTDMAMAVEKKEDLGEAIAKGGVPMQQAVAAMLAKAGQYIRRERSFAGVAYDTPVVNVDHEQYDGISQALALVQDFSVEVQSVAAKIDDEIKAEAGAISSDNATGGAGANSILFTSIMHNIINQMLLAMKAGPVAQRAIEAIKRGEKPVITLANTMESFLTDYAEEIGVKVGDVLDADFSRVLQKYLDRTRTLIIKKPFMKKGEKGERKYLTDEELGPRGLDLYNSAKAHIESLVLTDLPVSPIDKIKQEIADAGYRAGEITGRGTIMDYSGDEPILRNRPGKETSIRGRLDTIKRFNNGELDVVVLNQSGATGLSLHASRTFKDQRQRHMMIAQAEANIDTHMQMLGRVHRTGQVIVPKYSQLVADIPAEKRPAAVLAKKMASLNANTTASRGGALTAKDVPDFINEYGDQVAAVIIADDLVLNHRLGNAVKIDQDTGRVTIEDAMRKVTGRIPLLPLAEQEELYERLEADYSALLEQKAAMGENALEAQTLDLKARPLERTEVVKRKAQSESPFAMPVYIEKTSIVRQGKPYTPDEVIRKVLTEIGATDIPDVLPYEAVLQNLENPHSPWGGMAVENERNRRMEALTEFDTFQRAQLDKIDKEKPDEIEKQRLKLNAVKDRWEIIHQTLRPGARIILKTSQGNLTSIVTKVEQTGATANPLALSSWKATFALASAERQVTLPFSRLYENGKSSSDDMSAVEIQLVGWTQTPADTIKMFTSLQNGSREERYIATGNMLAAYDWLGMKGRIINYTDEAGNLRQGVLTAKDFDLKKHYSTKARPIRDPQEIVAWLKNNQHKIMWSDDEVVRLMLEYDRLHVSTEAAKRTGGKFYLDKPLTDLTGDFWKKGPVMTTDIGNVTDAKMTEIVSRLQKLGAVFVDQSEQGPPPTEKIEQPKTEPEDEARTSITRVSLTPRAAQSRAKLQAAVLAAIEQVAGPQVAQRTVTPDTINIRPGRDWNLKEGETVESVGYYSPKNERTGAFPLIAVALANNFDAVRTAYHEGWHAIEGVLLDTEIAVLRRETDRLRQFVMQQFPNEADMIARAEAEEIWAEAAALYARARTSDGLVGGIHIAVRRIFEKIMRLLARIRGDVRELGFFEAQDIFEAFRSGEFGKAREQMPADMRRRWWNDEGALATSTRRRAARPGDVIPPPERVGANWAASLGRPWKERVSDAIDALLLKPARGIWDEQIDLLRFQKAAALVDGSAVSESLDTYLAAGLYPGKVGERMKDAQRDLWRPIFEAMRDRKVGRDELHEYLYARHAPERNAAIREIDPANDAGSGMSDDEAQQIMDAIDGSGRMADFVAVAEFIDRVVQANRDTIRREGLETDETMDAWAEKYDHYVPLKGWENGAEDELAMPSPSGGQGFATRGPESRRALGRFDRADDILANLFDQTQRTVVRAEKNRVAKTFLRFAREYPSPYYKIGLLETHRQINPLTGLVETYTVNASPNRDEVFAAKVGGRTYFIEIRHPGLLNALKSLGLTRLNPVLRLMRRLTREYSRFQTSKNPEFILVSNFERDIIDAAINISAEQRERFIRRFWANLPRAMGGSILGVTETGASRHARQMFEEWREAGGKISSYGLRDLEDISREMQRELNQRLESTTKTVLMTPLRFVNPFEGRFVKFLEAIADVMESTTRLAVYMAGRDIGLTRAQAANMGRNATVDFNKRGSAGHIFNALYSFSGANIQGNVNTLRRLRKSSTMRRAMGALMIAGYLMTLWNMSVSPEDEDKKRGYEKRKYWERERYIYIYMPGMKRPIKYNMPFVIKPFWMAGEQAAMAHLGKVGVGEAIGNVLGTTVSAFNPLGSQGSLFDLNSWTRGLFPTVLRPIPELSLNQNWTGNKIHPDTMPWTQHLPRSDRHKALTHPAAVNVAEFLNRVTGGNKFEPGWASLYPDDIQYGWDFALGGLGRFLNNTSGTIKDYVDGVDRPAERLPFVRNIIGSDNSAPSQDDYYKQRTETAAKGQRLRAAIRARAEGTDDGSADEVIERLARETGARASRNGRGVSVPGETVFRQADTQIKRLRQEETEIRNNKKLSSEERRVKILGLREQMRDIMRNARGSVPAP